MWLWKSGIVMLRTSAGIMPPRHGTFPEAYDDSYQRLTRGVSRLDDSGIVCTYRWAWSPGPPGMCDVGGSAVTTRWTSTASRARATARGGEASADARLGPVELLELAPTAARLGLMAGLRAARWATSSTLAAGRRAAGAVRDGERPDELLSSAQAAAVRAARETLGVTELERRLSHVAPPADGSPDDGSLETQILRERTRELLDRSARLGSEPPAHPAFGLMLEQLDPDEARVLRFLAREGSQPMVDVVATGPLGVRGDHPLGERITVLAEAAGCRKPESLQLYLDNLLRLALVRLGDDPLDEEPLYDLLEAQPAVTGAKEETGTATRTKVVRRRIELSELGRCFCDQCLPVE